MLTTWTGFVLIRLLSWVIRKGNRLWIFAHLWSRCEYVKWSSKLTMNETKPKRIESFHGMYCSSLFSSFGWKARSLLMIGFAIFIIVSFDDFLGSIFVNNGWTWSSRRVWASVLEEKLGKSSKGGTNSKIVLNGSGSLKSSRTGVTRCEIRA